jgi:3D (Asp-Asp-Asp) domain-containing protein
MIAVGADVAITQDMIPGAQRRRRIRMAARALAFTGIAALTAASAVIVKENRTSARPLAAVEFVELESAAAGAGDAPSIIQASHKAPAVPAADAATRDAAPAADAIADPSIRWFNGRPVRPARSMWMTVTGYSPDARSCGDSADGITATLHSVWTNNMQMVAADTRVLPFGSMLTVPGYGGDQIVPVLDRGGAIKGKRLDLLYPTHEQALKWGRQKIKVIVWEYADGKPADNPRKFR